MTTEAAIRHSLFQHFLHGQRHLRGCDYLELAAYFGSRGEPERALVESLEALRYVDHEVDEEAFDCAVHAMATYLDLCPAVNARIATLLREIRIARHRPASRPWVLHRWLEALVFKRRHRFDEALATLRGARRALARLGAWRDVLRVTLDEIGIYLDTGNDIDAVQVGRAVLEDLEEAADDAEDLVDGFREYVAVLKAGGLMVEASERVRGVLMAAAG